MNTELTPSLSAADVRFPAEWEAQDAILLAWPTLDTDWAERLAEVEETYIALILAITVAGQDVILIVADDDVESYAQARLSSNRVEMGKLHFVQIPYDDTWLRDTGPITLIAQSGVRSIDFRFTGWGGKFGASDDDRIVQRLSALRVFNNGGECVSVDFALEGGGIETDGDGTLLSTWNCLHLRHPGKSREQIEQVLKQHLQQRRVLWLEHGYLEGDDTDAHIDTLARFATPASIVFQACDDPSDSHYDALQKMQAELQQLRTCDGAPYQLFALPWAQPILDDGRRLAASYANFLIINGKVLIPAYGDARDGEAAAVMQSAFPQHEIVQIPCRALIWQNGSLHCISMQLPKHSVNWESLQ